MKRPGTSQSLRRFHALRRERLRVLPSDLTAIERGLPMRPENRELLSPAVETAERLLEALGDRVSEQERLLVYDVARLDVLVGALFRRALTAADGETAELATKIGTLVGQRRASLLAIGLRERREEKSLDDFLAARTADGAIITPPERGSASGDDHAACKDGPLESRIAECVIETRIATESTPIAIERGGAASES